MRTFANGVQALAARYPGDKRDYYLVVGQFTSAMPAGVDPRLWEIGDMVEVIEDWESAND
jgi:hypothetical protein